MIATSSVSAPVFDHQGSRPTSTYPRAERHLLIVQNSEAVGRALKRLLSSLYDTIHVIRCPQQATEILREAQGTVDVVCGQRYGDQAERHAAFDWVTRWRQEASVGYVVLTTSEPPAQLPAGVDTIFCKPLDPRALMRFLRAPLHYAA